MKLPPFAEPASRYTITVMGIETEQSLEEIEAEGGFAHLFTVAHNLGLGPVTVHVTPEPSILDALPDD